MSGRTKAKEWSEIVIKIAVCDDEEIVRKKLYEIIEKWFGICKRQVWIAKYNNGVELLESHVRFDIIFMDIEMPQLNGIETAKMLRTWDVNSKIIYVTNYEQYIRISYKVHAFDYISKPIQEKDIYTVLAEAVKYLDAVLERPKYAFDTEDGVIVLELDSIYYFEYSLRRVIINSTKGEYVTKEYSLKELLEKFREYDFGSPHKSFIVNLMYVKLVKGFDVFMENGVTIPLAQKKAAAFRIRFNDFLQSTFYRI